MSTARTWGVALSGIDGRLVEIEADLSDQLPGFTIIGLPDKSLGEAVTRVRNATANCGVPLARRRLTVNLSPASVPKQGSGFDVGIAVAALATEGLLDPASLARTVHIGELGLDGRVRPVPGVLPAVLAAVRAGTPRVVVPRSNAAEAALVEGADVIAAGTLVDVLRAHGADVEDIELEPVVEEADPVEEPAPRELADVMGQRDAVDALVVAAAGGHHLLLSGPPGAGKTMLAERLPAILPPLTDAEALEVAAVRSLAGGAISGLPRTPPLERPHHTASVASLVGGGSRQVRPGAVARATHGVLFLDEAGEFPTSALDALRQPLESGLIDIHRAGVVARYPARFQLVLATNPCPCGQYGVPGGACVCAPNAVRRYLARLSGPLLDRVDIALGVRRVSTVAADTGMGGGLTTVEARARVVEARARAERRLAGTGWRLNARVPGTWLRSGPVALDTSVRRPLDSALHRGTLTLRGYDRVLRLAWTLADLRARPRPDLDDLGHALFLKQGIPA